MTARLYVEGGGNSNELQRHCREGFAKLLENCGYEASSFRIISCGSREETFRRFKLSLNGNASVVFVLMWIDSEEPLNSVEKTWSHLANRDGWERPGGVDDEQVLFMTTCMEAVIAADRAALRDHYRSKLHEKVLPPVVNLESRDRKDLLKKLQHATRDCSNGYSKGKRSFEILAKLNPDTLQKNLPSFKRAVRILNGKLKPA